MKIAVCPGSFDPVTFGHLDIIRRASLLFDQVIVAVLHNPAKAGFLPVEERLRLIRLACGELDNVTAGSWDGLLADYVRKTGAVCVVRGLRGGDDLVSESRMAELNRRLNPQVETVFLPARPEHACLSSSAVREILAFGGSVAGLVPPAVEEALKRKASSD